jgi:hypothetical protein
MGPSSPTVRRTIVASLGAIVMVAAGCSGEKPPSASQDAADRLKKEAAAQKQMRERESQNK